MDFIQLAQIVADQYVYYDTLLQDENHYKILESECSNAVSERMLGDAISSFLPRSHRCTLDECANLGASQKYPGNDLQNPIRLLQRRAETVKGPQSPAKQPLPHVSLFKPPDVLVRRGESLMEISSAALDFWKELGLSPMNGSKDIIAFCLYPDTEMLHRGAQSLLEAISQTYLSLKLGVHTAGHPALKDYPSGLVAIPVYENVTEALKSMNDAGEQFGTSNSRSSRTQY